MGQKTLKYAGLQCHRIAAPMRAKSTQARFEILDPQLRLLSGKEFAHAGVESHEDVRMVIHHGEPASRNGDDAHKFSSEPHANLPMRL